MPYIREADRLAYAVCAPTPLDDPGILNFQITTLILNYWRANGPRYAAINDIVGALEGVKAEFQRRAVADYEDLKIIENGDLYG